MKYLNLYNTMSCYTEASATFARPHVSYIEDEDLVIYDDVQPTDWSKEYLTFLALEDGTFSRNGGFMYRIGDGTTWGEWTLANEETSDVTTTIGTTPLIHAGEKVQFHRGGGGGEKFTSTGRFEAMGNINSIVWGTNLDNLDLFNGAHTLQKTFSNCTGLTSAENLVLPATGLIDSCYMSMFEGCTNLVKAPKVLPATALTNSCYENMFSNCTSLTTAPELPATTLAEYCYNGMFYGCTSLTEAPALPATTLGQSCYSEMFSDCTSLKTAPSVLPATTLASSCYQYMFAACTSLTAAPVLPATTLAEYCYNGMFRDCTSLTTAPALPATTLGQSCYSEMFWGCTSLTTAPALPATTLAEGCYQFMFYNCTSLNYIKMLATNTSALTALYNWTYGVPQTGTFVKHPDATLPSGTKGIPAGWTVQTATE